ncbi:VanZ family protein [Mucilaginibacter sp. UR6-11]|uniref:VanZ family protein n=1 Tax=Mucilaginibacter sp. UR6-11 TaxID=1435644 RepID=UPI001E524F4A|nr:VanZ family protein [Mucilaginibacter sp. UR6-11]MCC8424707.1 VanZ family protein [Mucilaginibacter sp. UR6-11]
MCNADFGSVGKSHLFFPGFDKLVHCGFFFMMVVLSCNGYIRKNGAGNLWFKPAFVITLLAILYGAIIELLQLWVFTWRSGEWNDLFADTVGAGMAIFSILVTTGALKYEKK